MFRFVVVASTHNIMFYNETEITQQKLHMNFYQNKYVADIFKTFSFLLSTCLYYII